VVIFLAVIGALIGSLIGGSKNKYDKDKSGCGSVPTWKFDDTNHSNVIMGHHTFLVHLPPLYDSNIMYPVILSFHGYGDNNTFQEHIMGLSEPKLKINGQVR
jgi:hypothetical protein